MGNSEAGTCLPGLGPARWGWDSWEMRLSPVTGALRGEGAGEEQKQKLGPKGREAGRGTASKTEAEMKTRAVNVLGLPPHNLQKPAVGSALSLRAPSCPELSVVQQWDFSGGSATCPESHRLLCTPANTVPLGLDVGRCTCLRTKRS